MIEFLFFLRISDRKYVFKINKSFFNNSKLPAIFRIAEFQKSIFQNKNGTLKFAKLINYSTNVLRHAFTEMTSRYVNLKLIIIIYVKQNHNESDFFFSKLKILLKINMFLHKNMFRNVIQ